jgi:hypothetical protein
MRYTKRVIKPSGLEFETFCETPGVEQTLLVTVASLDASHELWAKGLSRTNAHQYEKNDLLRKEMLPPSERESVDPDVYDFSDIDELFQEEGKGPHMIELDFFGDPQGPVDYINKNEIQSKWWKWTHRFTGYSLKRFLNPGGRSYETGRLVKYLKIIKEHEFPLAYARGKHILLLNDCLHLDNSEENNIVIQVLERKDLLKQQVTTSFAFMILTPLVLTPHLLFSSFCYYLRSRLCFLPSRQILLQSPYRVVWPSCSFVNCTC